MGIVRELMGDRFPSLGRLAEEIHRRWSDDGPPSIESRGLAAKLSDLDKGKDVWWRNHRNALDHLASILEASPDEIVAPVGAANAREMVTFREFPELKPLDLRHEEPAPIWSKRLTGGRLGDSGGLLAWFKPPQFSGNQPATWLHLPHGSGKSLVVQWYRLRKQVRARSVARLSDAAEELRAPGPLVLEVEEAGGEDDLRLLASLDEGIGWNKLILAPFDLPSAKLDTQFTWEGRHGSLEERVSPRISSEWSRAEAPLAEDWRGTFVAWLGERLANTDTLFTPGAFRQWLDKFDVSGSIVRTPSDLLFFARMLHQRGERWVAKARPDALLKQWVVSSASTLEGSASAVQLWLDAHGVQLLQQISERRLRAVELPWGSPLSSDQWQSLVPPELAPSQAASESLQRQIDELIDAPRKADRSDRAARLRKELEGPRAAEVVSYLKRARLLVAAGSDGYLLNAGWVERLVAVGAFSELLETDLAQWARLATAGERRSVAAAMLERLSEDELANLVARAVKLSGTDLFACVATVEILFSLFSVRLHGRIRSAEPAHHILLEAQLKGLIVRWNDLPPAPLLRPGVGEKGDLGLNWLADCWSWSLHIRPDQELASRVPDPAKWLFPGWFSADAALPAPPPWLERCVVAPRRSANDHETKSVAPVLFRLARLANGIADRIGPRIFDFEVPEVMLAAALPQAPGANPSRVAAAIARLMEAEWVNELVSERLAGVPEDAQAPLAGALWKALMVLEVEQPQRSFAWLLDRVLRGWVLSRLSLPDFMASLTEYAQVATALTRLLPPSLRAALGRWLSQHQPSLLPSYARSESAWGPDDVEGLLAASEHTGPAPQRQVWLLAPTRAQEAFEQSLAAGNDEHACHWITSAPEAELSGLADRVDQRANFSQNLRWAFLRVLPEAGRAAARILALISAKSTTQANSR